MKFNSNKDLYKGITYKFPIHNVINSPIITNQETEFPNEFNKVLEITDNHNENSTKHINIFREFFVEHKTKVLLIVFLNKPETFISFDSKVREIMLLRNNLTIYFKIRVISTIGSMKKTNILLN